jgi:predicted RNA polymerase sigma factor
LYESLEKLKPGPITALNKAIATGYAQGRAQGLNLLLEIESLEHNNRYHTAIGDFYFDMNEKDKAASAYDLAFRLTASEKERNLLLRKIAATQRTDQAIL